MKKSNISSRAMKKPSFASLALPLALTATLLAGCSKQPQQQTTNEQPQQYPQQAPNAAGQQAINPNAAPPVQQAPPPQEAYPPQQQANSAYAPQPSNGGYNSRPAPPPEPSSYTIPAGTHIRITTRQTLGSKISQPGESFSATVSAPVVVRGVTLVRSGSSATGTVVAAKGLGHIKGQAQLALRLDSVRSGGQTYQVESSTIDRIEKGKGKRTALFAGGGGGIGALIGGLAGGGKGALIGGLAGAGGGTAAGAFTGNKEIVIPAETPLTFRLERSVTVSR